MFPSFFSCSASFPCLPKHFDVHLRLRNIDPRGIKQATARQGAVAVLHQLRAEQDKTCLGGAKTCGMGHCNVKNTFNQSGVIISSSATETIPPPVITIVGEGVSFLLNQWTVLYMSRKEITEKYIIRGFPIIST